MKPNSAVKEATNSKKDLVRRILRNLQPSTTNEENLVGGGRIRWFSVRPKRGKTESPKSKKITTEDKTIQAAQRTNIKIEIEGLTSLAGPSCNYWEAIAERRRVALEDTLEQKKEVIEQYEKLRERYEKRGEQIEKLCERYEKRGKQIEELCEQYEKLEEQNEKLEEQNEKLEEENEKLEEQNEKLEKQNEKLLKGNRLCKEMLDETNAFVEVLENMIGDDSSDINNSLEDNVYNL